MYNQMKFGLQDRLVRWIIYLQILVGFSFRQEGLGIISPAFPFILLLLLLQFFGKSSTTKVFGDRHSFNLILVFFIFGIISSVITLFTFPEAVITRPLGVLISLVFFFLVYYSISRANKDSDRTLIFFNDFVNVCSIHSILTITEYIIHTLTKKNYVYEFVIGTLAFLRFPNANAIQDYSHEGRYKGFLPEPGDVGIFAVPAFAAMLAVLLFGKERRLSYYIPRLLLASSAILMSGSTTSLQMLILVTSICLLIRFVGSYFFDRSHKINFINLFLIYSSLAIFAGVAGLSILLQFQDILPAFVQDRITGLTSYSETGSFDKNTNLSVQVILNCQNAVQYTLQHRPLWGYGLGYFSIPFDKALEISNAKVSDLALKLNRDDGYSMGLRLMGEVGIIGTLIFLSVFWVRLSQLQKLFSSLFLYKKYISPSILGLTTEGVIMTTAAALSILVISILNKGSYWSHILPILFGLCFKSDFASKLNLCEFTPFFQKNKTS